MMKTIGIFLLSLILTACASGGRNIQQSHDESINFADFKSFSVEAVQHMEELNAVNDMITAAFVQQLQAKGMRYVKSGEADLYVRFATKVTSGQEMKAEYIPAGKGVYTRYNMEAVNEGEFLVNMVDNRTKKVVWKASSIRDMAGVDIGKISQEKINEGLSRVLEGFPPQ